MPAAIQDSVLENFHKTSLEEVMRASLTERMERKYIFRGDILPDILGLMANDFDLMIAGNEPVQLYESVYFDTPGFSAYNAHHNGAGNRYKIRLRKYYSTSACFLEVKHRTPTGQIKKWRIEIPDLSVNLLDFSDFIRNYSPFPPEELEEKIRTYYYRITLVNKNFEERITFDYGLSFSAHMEKIDFSPLVIAEFKFSKALRRPSCESTLQRFHLRSTSVSKYCTGVASIYQNVRKNNFKQKLRTINRIIFAHHENTIH